MMFLKANFCFSGHKGIGGVQNHPVMAKYQSTTSDTRQQLQSSNATQMTSQTRVPKLCTKLNIFFEDVDDNIKKCYKQSMH